MGKIPLLQFRCVLLTDAMTSNALHNGTTIAQGVFIEALITTALVLAVLMLSAEKSNTTPFAPVCCTEFSFSEVVYNDIRYSSVLASQSLRPTCEACYFI